MMMTDVKSERVGTVSRDEMHGVVLTDRLRRAVKGAATVVRRQVKVVDFRKNVAEAMRGVVPMDRRRHAVKGAMVTQAVVMLARHATLDEATRAVTAARRPARGVENAAEAMRGAVPMAHRHAVRNAEATGAVVMLPRHATLAEAMRAVAMARHRAKGVVNVAEAMRGVVPMARRHAVRNAEATEDVVMLARLATLAEAMRAVTVARHPARGVENAAESMRGVVPMARRRHAVKGAEATGDGATVMAEDATVSEDDAMRVKHLHRRLAVVAMPSPRKAMSRRIGSLDRGL